MKRYLLTVLMNICMLTMLQAQYTAPPADSSITYVAGEGLYIRLGKLNAHTFNILTTVQAGGQYNRIDSVNSNRLSLNLVRLAFTGSVLRDKVSMALVTDFAGVTPILEGWIGFSVLNKKGKLYIGQRQTHTNNRLAMADERFAHNLGQTLAGKSNDGIVYGGLMQNFVGATREGGLFLETNIPLGSWKLYPSVSVTTGEGQNFFDMQNNTGFKYGGRLDILPLGDFIKNNAFIAEDIYREPTPKLAVGIAGSYNIKAGSPMGSESTTINSIYNKKGEADFADYGKLVADIMFKLNGFSLIGEYTNSIVRGKELYLNQSASNRLTPEMAATYYHTGSAINVLTAYVTRSGWSAGGRYTHIEPEFNTAESLVKKQNWHTLTVNKYLKNNALRAGINVSYLTSEQNGIKSKSWLGNLAVQISL